MARTPAKKAAAPATPRASSSKGAGLGVARRGGTGQIFTSASINVDFAGPEHRVIQIDLELDGVYHGEASYEGRVFLNNAAATAATPRALESGYAGSFHVFGHGGCLGDPGHCDINDHNREALDLRPGHPLTPITVRVNVTNTLRAIASTTPAVSVTIVPVISAANELCDTETVLRFAGMRFVAYNP